MSLVTRSLGPVRANISSVPRGHYLAAEVGQLAGVSGKKIGQWARRGYIQSSWSSESPRIYSYQDAAEAMVVHELEDLDVAPRAIGDAVQGLREQLGTDWPLQSTQLFVPGGHPRRVGHTRTIAVRSSAGHLDDVVMRHPVLGRVDFVAIKRDLSKGGWVARLLPGLRYIEVNPDRLSGRPAIKGHRIAAADVARLAVEFGEEVPRQEYGLGKGQIGDAVRWWLKVREFEQAA